MSLRADAADLLGEIMDVFRTDGTREELLEAGETIVSGFHLVGAATLLVDGNSQGFFLNLCRMAENWRRLIRLLRSRGLEPPSARHTTALLGALAAGDFDLADALAAESATPRQADDYEDEHLWATILQGLARLTPPPPGSLEPLIQKLEAVGSEEYPPRCEMARALLAPDAKAFREAFEAARLGYEIATEEKAKDFTTPVTPFAPHRFLWLEGLALLRLAERRGVVPASAQYTYCPPLARVPMTARYQGDWTIPDVS